MTRLACLMALLLLTPPAMAQGNLLDQGRNLLQQRGGAGGAPLGGAANRNNLSVADISGGLKDALKVGAQRTVGRIGKADGYLKDSAIHIPLPASLEKARSALAMVGASGMLDDLETRMNRAAEKAAPKALEIFTTAISKMSIEDARGILNGPQDAATQYFKRTTTEPLGKAFRPVIDKTLSEAGAVQTYNAMKARAGPLADLGGFDLNGFALEKALAGLFHYIAAEEAAIRTDPAKRSTELLKKVFGQ